MRVIKTVNLQVKYLLTVQTWVKIRFICSQHSRSYIERKRAIQTHFQQFDFNKQLVLILKPFLGDRKSFTLQKRLGDASLVIAHCSMPICPQEKIVCGFCTLPPFFYKCIWRIFGVTPLSPLPSPPSPLRISVNYFPGDFC